MGNIVTIGSGDGTYLYKLPSIPKERDILYYDIPKAQQYWRTPHDNKKQLEIRDIKQMSERDRIAYIEMWRNRWDNGMWYMNNGEPTYINGLHVDHLVFNKFSDRHLFYLDAQRLRMYFRELTNNDPLCDGRVWTKPRRAGITYEERTEAIRCVISGVGYNIGMQSTKEEVCSRTLMRPIIDTYLSRPKWMRESIDMPNGRKPKKKLELSESKFNDNKEDDSLKGYIQSFTTIASAFDSDEWMLLILDEFSKWETCNPRESLNIGQKAATNPGKRGKIDCLSTTGDSKDAVKATIEWHKLIAESNPAIRDANGKTISGLYKFFISAIDSMFVHEELKKQGKNNLDLYGFVNKEMSEEWIWNEHNKHAKDSKDYIFSLYKLPLKEEHTLLSSSTYNLFPKVRCVSRLAALEKMPVDGKPYIRGILTEPDGLGRSWFEPDSKGLWLWAVQPYFSIEKNIDLRNRFKFSDGIYFLPPNPEGVIGYDPIDYSKKNTKANSSSLSEACLFIRKKHNYFNVEFDSGVMALWLGRMDDPTEVNKEAMKACRFTGFPCMHEKSVNHVYEDFRDAGMINFLMEDGDGNYGISPSNTKYRKDGIAMLQARYAAPKTKEDKDEIEEYPFEDGLRNLINFDPSDTQPFDITMAELYCEHGLKQLVYTNVSDNESQNKRRIFNEIFPPVN
jgi:hypothetical protein